MMEENEQVSQSETKQQSWFEYHGFPKWLIAFGWVVVSFILFQIVGGLVSILLIYFQHGQISDLTNMASLKNHLGSVFIGNSTGQILFLGLGTVFVSRYAAPGGNISRFLGFRTHGDTYKIIGLTVVLLFAIQPVIWFCVWINSLIPFPASYMSFEKSQDEIIQAFLTGPGTIWIILFHVALIPAICEEVMYRGFLLNILKRGWGVAAAIIISGILFGLYHIRFTQLIPLSGLGMLLGYIAWKADSIFPAMAAHFTNNAIGIFISYFFPNFAFSKNNTESMPPLLWVIPSIVISAYLLYIFINTTKSRKEYGHV